MITVSEPPRRNNRLLLIALLASLAVHLIVALLYVVTSDALARLLPRVAVHQQHPKPNQDEIVTLSSALHIEKRAHPAPAQQPRRAAVRPRSQPPAPLQKPAPPIVARVPKPLPVAKPVLPAPALLKAELAKFDRHAPSQPARTTHAKTVSKTPTAPPRTPEPKKVVAALPQPHPVTQQRQETQPQRPARLSEQQIAQIESDLAKTIAQSRADTSTLSTVSHPRLPPAATKRQPIDMSGIDAMLGGVQAACYPVRSWRAQGFNYYYVSCRAVHADGLVREEAVPWPVRFRPRVDPYDPYDDTLSPQAKVPLQQPLPDWQPQPGMRIDPDLVDYLHQLGYHI